MRNLDYNLLSMLIIDEILRKRGMKERELAAILGVSLQSVNSVIRQRENTSLKKLQKYADALGVSVGELFDDNEF